MSDLSQEEEERYMTGRFRSPHHEKGQKRHRGEEAVKGGTAAYTSLDSDGHRVLREETPIDWFARGKVGPVKEQGSCASCWAFAGTSVLEAMVAIRDDAAP